MARPRKYHIDETEVLQAVYNQTVRLQDQIDEKLDSLPRDANFFADFQSLHKERSRAKWCRYSVEDLLGRQMTDSERKATGRVVRELERNGHLHVDGRRGSWVRLSELGLQRIQHLHQQKEN